MAGFAFLAIPLCAESQFVYVASQFSGVGVYAYTMNASTGVLTAVPGSPYPAGQYALSMAVHPTKAFLYVASQGVAAGVYAFAVDPASGALTLIAGSPFPAGVSPSTIAVAASGKFAYSTDEAGAIYAFQIDPTTGALTAAPGSPLSTPGTSQTAIIADPFDRFAYAASGANGTISGYSINSVTGALTAIPGSTIAASGPVSLAANGSYLYATAALGATKGVYAFVINNSGLLTPIAGSPFTAGSIPFRAALARGEFLYVANAEFAGGVSAYKVTLSNGQLTAVGGSPFAVGNNPQGVAVDYRGNFVYVSTFNGGTHAFSIDLGTAALKPVPGSPFTAPYASRAIVTLRLGTIYEYHFFERGTHNVAAAFRFSGIVRDFSPASYPIPGFTGFISPSPASLNPCDLDSNSSGELDCRLPGPYGGIFYFVFNYGGFPRQLGPFTGSGFASPNGAVPGIGLKFLEDGEIVQVSP